MSSAVYADTRFTTMQAVQATEGIHALAYAQQTALVESLIRPGMTVLDVGCGPALSYRADQAYVIGLDPSAASLAVNTDVDDRIVGSATSIPLPYASADLVVAFYSVHHMTTQTFDGSDIRREWALAEMQRVLRPGGSLLVFEMVPHGWVWALERIFWDVGKALLGDRLDMLFWPTERYARTPLGAPTVQTFDCSSFSTFAPIFALPWLRIPRFLFPFSAVVYRWVKE